jgi:hypothetical protein
MAIIAILTFLNVILKGLKHETFKVTRHEMYVKVK